MTKKYCTTCGSHVMQNFVKCPNCGGQSWSPTAILQPTGPRSGPSTINTPGTQPQTGSRQGLLQAIPYTARKTFTLQGRASRSEYWWFFLFQSVALVALAFLIALAASRYNNSSLVVLLGILLACFYIWMTICGVSLTVRRLHDQDRSGWWLAILLLAYVGFGFIGGFEPKLDTSMNGLSTIVTLGWLIFISQKGSSGANKYGNEPMYFT